MSARDLGLYILGIGWGSALLASCAGAPPTSAPAGLNDAGRAVGSPVMSYTRAKHPRRESSWMAFRAERRHRLLYISDWETDAVYVYDYRSGDNVGMLTGFSRPYGQCVDAKGDVWVTDLDGERVSEYAHGGSARLRSLATDGRAIGCAVAPDGDLAVANLDIWNGSSYVAGNFDVFRNGSGPAQKFVCPHGFYYWPPGYDDQSNLYVQTATDVGTTELCELPFGQSVTQPVSTNAHIYVPGSVMWNGKHITLTDQLYHGGAATGVYEVGKPPVTTPFSLTVMSSTDLSDDCDGNNVSVVQPFVVGKRNTPLNRERASVIVGGNLWCQARFNFWPYVSGGYPKRSLAAAPQQPEGASVSIATTP